MVCKCTHSMSAARVRRASLRLRPTKRRAFAGDDRIPRRRLEDLAPDDWRRGNPRFQGGAFERKVALADRVRELAGTKGCTPAQLALAWLLTREYVIPIPGTSNAESIVGERLRRLRTAHTRGAP